MNIGHVNAGSTTAQVATSFQVKVANGADKQQEAVVGQIMSSIEQTPAPNREGFQTGKIVNVSA